MTHKTVPREPDAWQHNCLKESDCDFGPFAVIHNATKKLWMSVKPEQVEHYTIPLYAKPAEQGDAVALLRRIVNAGYEDSELEHAMQQARAYLNALPEQA